MRKYFLGWMCLALVASVVGTQAQAQQIGQNSNSTSSAGALSGSESSAKSSSAGVGTGGTSSLSYSNVTNANIPSNTTVHNTPDVGIPGLFGGTNPCTVGVTGGMSLAGVGVAGGAQWAAAGCERRNASVILFQANMPDVAVALLCQDDQIRVAFREVGRPCPADRAQTAAVAAPAPVAMTPAPVQAQQAPAPAPVQQPIAVAAAGGKPDWCATARPGTGADRTTYEYYCR